MVSMDAPDFSPSVARLGLRENATMNAAVGAGSRMDEVFCDLGSGDVM